MLILANLDIWSSDSITECVSPSVILLLLRLSSTGLDKPLQEDNKAMALLESSWQLLKSSTSNEERLLGNVSAIIQMASDSTCNPLILNSYNPTNLLKNNDDAAISFTKFEHWILSFLIIVILCTGIETEREIFTALFNKIRKASTTLSGDAFWEPITVKVFPIHYNKIQWTTKLFSHLTLVVYSITTMKALTNWNILKYVKTAYHLLQLS